MITQPPVETRASILRLVVIRQPRIEAKTNSDFWSEEVVFGVRKDGVAVLEYSDGINLYFGREAFDQRSPAGGSIGDAQALWPDGTGTFAISLQCKVPVPAKL